MDFLNSIEIVAEKKGWQLIMHKPINENPDDSNLYYALVKNETDEFATYLYNKEFKGFYHGNYFNNKDEAINDYLNRLRGGK